MVEVDLTGSGVVRTIPRGTKRGPESRALTGTACTLAASRHLKSVEFSFSEVLRLHIIATSKLLSGWQQVTLLEWLEKVKALSKKSTEGAVVVFPREPFFNILQRCAQSLPT